MPYGLRYSAIAAADLAKVPPEVVTQIDTGMVTLANDPIRYGRPPASPPYPPFGHQYDIACRDGAGKRYNCVVFFVYSDCGEFLDIHRMQIQPVGHYPPQPTVR